MQPVVYGVSTLAIATIFYIWRSYHEFMLRKDKILRERVTYMLWTMAQTVN